MSQLGQRQQGAGKGRQGMSFEKANKAGVKENKSEPFSVIAAPFPWHYAAVLFNSASLKVNLAFNG